MTWRCKMDKYYSVAIILDNAPCEYRTIKIFDAFNGASIINFSKERNIDDIIDEHIIKYYDIISNVGNAFILKIKENNIKEDNRAIMTSLGIF